MVEMMPKYNERKSKARVVKENEYIFPPFPNFLYKKMGVYSEILYRGVASADC
jgi:hypothetical protein